MTVAELLNSDTPSRQLMRALRLGVTDTGDPDMLPESFAWHVYLELRRRSEPDADTVFLRTLRGLHSRRSIAGVELPVDDSDPEEHRLADDPYLADLWKAYKKCIRNNRTGPAAQLLRDIEEQLGVH